MITVTKHFITMSTSQPEMYIVYLYCDYRKEVDLQHLKVFLDRQKAIDFAQKYADKNQTEAEYVCIKGTEYDAAFSYPNEDDDSDYDIEKTKHEQLKVELGVKPGMWYMRIAVDKVVFDT